jgi:toxin CptA
MVPQRIAISPSAWIAAALCAAHTAAAVLVWLVPIPVTGKFALTAAAALSLVFFVARDAALHAAHSIVALEIRDGGEAAFQTRRGEWLDCEITGSSYVSPRLTIVNLRPRLRWGTRRLILVPDNVDARDFRRLRTWLRWKGD